MTNKISLRAAIVNSGITIEKLSQIFGVTRQAIWLRVKNYKKMKAQDLAKFCEIINFDINDLDLEEK